MGILFMAASLSQFKSHSCLLKPFWTMFHSFELLFLFRFWPFSSSLPTRWCFKNLLCRCIISSVIIISVVIIIVIIIFNIQIILHRISSELPEKNLTVWFFLIPIFLHLSSLEELTLSTPVWCLWGTFIHLPDFRVLSFNSFDPSIFFHSFVLSTTHSALASCVLLKEHLLWLALSVECPFCQPAHQFCCPLSHGRCRCLILYLAAGDTSPCSPEWGTDHGLSIIGCFLPTTGWHWLAHQPWNLLTLVPQLPLELMPLFTEPHH